MVMEMMIDVDGDVGGERTTVVLMRRVQGAKRQDLHPGTNYFGRSTRVNAQPCRSRTRTSTRSAPLILVQFGKVATGIDFVKVGVLKPRRLPFRSMVEIAWRGTGQWHDRIICRSPTGVRQSFGRRAIVRSFVAWTKVMPPTIWK